MWKKNESFEKSTEMNLTKKKNHKYMIAVDSTV